MSPAESDAKLDASLDRALAVWDEIRSRAPHEMEEIYRTVPDLKVNGWRIVREFDSIPNYTVIMVINDRGLRLANSYKTGDANERREALHKLVVPKPLIGKTGVKCLRCNQHFSGGHLCAADHKKRCAIRTMRGGWDGECDCNHATDHGSQIREARTK